MKNSPRLMFFFGAIAFAVIMILANKKGAGMDSKEFMETAEFWFYRVLTALAAASISISIPGMLNINYNTKGDGVGTMSENDRHTEPMTLAEKEPAITASGAIAVFILVYLFNPIV